MTGKRVCRLLWAAVLAVVGIAAVMAPAQAQGQAPFQAQGVENRDAFDGHPPPPRIEQWQRIDEQVAAMPHSQSKNGDVWFLGVAAYGEQKVFRKEAELAQQVFGAYYGAKERSLLLVNDVNDRRTYPLATYENLRYALRQIAQRMDRDNDILLLMLTSHGNDRDGIVFTNGHLPQDALSPQDLSRLLDENGIRWREVVVSACYSGIFIPPLESDTTLVMTAADEHHSSFGCADDRDLTYFGEALLHDVMPDVCSVEQAYWSMNSIINRREEEEHQIHSNPRLSVGPAMHKKLLQIDTVAGRSCVAGKAAGAAKAGIPQAGVTKTAQKRDSGHGVK